jgi:hypothetical protein
MSPAIPKVRRLEASVLLRPNLAMIAKTGPLTRRIR